MHTFTTSLTHLSRPALLIAAALILAGCLHQRPTTTPVDATINKAMEKPAISSAVMASKQEKRAPGSLWRAGASDFFEDQRARRVGDIVTVIVNETAKAETEANTETKRDHTSTSGLSNLLNLEGKLTNRGIPPGPSSLLDMESARDFTGEGSTDREDKLEARIAAMVVQVLPNGYLVIEGKRELIVNYELQELGIQGIIRPGDIAADNTITSEKIAEARITYAGRGIVDESQRPQYGARFLDKWLPF